MKSNWYRHEVGRAAKSKTDERVGTITSGGYRNLQIFIKGEDWETDFLTEDQFDLEWTLLDYAINRRGQKIEIGSYWTMQSPANKWFNDKSWIGKINGFGGNGFFSIDYVNWKRNGKGNTYNFSPNSFDTSNVEKDGFRKATTSEIEYFHKRRGKK